MYFRIYTCQCERTSALKIVWKNSVHYEHPDGVFQPMKMAAKEAAAAAIEASKSKSAFIFIYF